MLFSLRSRLMAAFSLLLIIPFTALVLLISGESAKQLRSSIEASTAQTIEQFGSHVNTFMKQVEEVGNQAMSNSITQQYIATVLDPDSSSQDRLITKQQLVDYLSSYAINNTSGINLSVFTDQSGGIWTQDRSYAEQSWHKSFLLEGKRWTGAHRDPDQADVVMKERLINSYMLPLVQLQSFTPAGFVKVNYPTALLRDSLDKIRFGQSGRAFLLGADGMSILSQQLTESEQSAAELGMTLIHEEGASSSGFFALEDSGARQLLFYRHIEPQDWYVIGIVPEKELFVELYGIRRFMLALGAVLLIAAIAVAWWLSYGITKPLSSMARAMKHVERGEFAQAVGMLPRVRTGHSEVGYVTRVFESMTARLRYLIETEFETNLRRKNAEYKALLLQINPHFFNNTLEIIGGLAAMKRNETVMDATEALGQMMRYSLNLNSDIVKVKEEMAYIRDYLFILQLRYENRLQIAIEEDEEAGELAIAKFILQPLVENAVKYSLEKEGTAVVSISVSYADGRLKAKIADNGIGMKPDLIKEMMEEGIVRDTADILNSAGESIGLRNVLARCRLYYGERLSIEIDSRLGEGTVIMLDIPAVKG